MKRPGKVIKPRKTNKPQKIKRPSNKEAVSVADLNWKPVDIPDTLDDYEGFYGLEEIDGVDVKIVDGQVQFLTSEDKNPEARSDGTEMADKEALNDDTEVADKKALNDDTEMAVKEALNDDTDMADEEDVKVQAEQEDDNKTEKVSAKKVGKEVKKAETKEQGSENSHKAKDSHTQNPFESLDQLPEEIELPKWNFDMPLSSYTILGLSQNGFTDPTPIQKKTIPLAMKGHDIIGKAITGSGKTLAYGIPILEKAYSQSSTQRGKSSPPVGIIFTPTRELAKQVTSHLQVLVKHSGFKKNDIMLLTGGLATQKQERLLNLGPSVIVATPGRFLEFLESSTAFTERMAGLDILVLDEADRLLQDGHFEELEKIIELLGKNRPRDSSIPRRWQTLVFSATFSLDLFGKLDKRIRHGGKEDGNEAVINLLSRKLRFKEKPAFIDVNPKQSVSGFVSEALIECGAVERDLYLYYFLMMYPGTTLVFANSISSVRRLVPLLNNLQIPTFALHSQLDQQHRFKALEKFKAECTKQQNGSQKPVVMVASDVAARGLDIPNITHVVHYHLPRSADFYIHRSGRTGRASTEGVAIMLCSPQEASGPLLRLRKLVSEKKGVGYNGRDSIKHLPIEMDLVNQLRPRISLAGELADAQISANAKQKEKSWVQKAADDLGLSDVSDLEEDDVLKRQRKRIEFKSRGKQEVKSTKAHLNSMLKQPIRKDARRSYLTGGLSNLADMMLKGQGHQSIVGHENVTALSHVKGKKKANKVKK